MSESDHRIDLDRPHGKQFQRTLEYAFNQIVSSVDDDQKLLADISHKYLLYAAVRSS